MSQKLLDRVRIGTPCQTDWQAMRGDDRVRFCGQCEKHVYNLSQMTRQQAERLIRKTNGNLCARFERRADGGIVTTEEVLPLPRFNVRFLRIASATMSAALSLAPTAAAKTSKNLPVLQQQATSTEQQSQVNAETGKISGSIKNPGGEKSRFALVTLFEVEADNKRTKLFTMGTYEFTGLTPGQYKVMVYSPHLPTYSSEIVIIKAGQSEQINVLMKSYMMEEMGTVSVETRAQRFRRTFKRALFSPFQKIKNSFHQ
jgi:hypothetical protein